jgi:YggT family protein
VPITCLIAVVLQLYSFVLLIRIILSWVSMFWSPPAALAPAIRVIYDLTEPVMAFFRRYIPPVGGFDLSPIIIFLLIGFIRSAIC